MKITKKKFAVLDHCFKCSETYLDKKVMEFTGTKNVVDLPEEYYIELLYKCTSCGRKKWINDYWIHRLQRVEEGSCYE